MARRISLKSTEPDETSRETAATTPPLTDAEQTARKQARDRTVAHQARIKEANAARRAREPRRNPLFDLAERERAKIFSFLRDCPYDDAIQQMAREMGLEAVTSAELTEFFQLEAENHWQVRMERAAHEANALVRLAEQHPAHFSSGILAALGQEAFRQIASGEAQPDAMNRMALLFLRAKADERAEQIGELKREKLRQEMRGQIELALEELSNEVNRRPAAREAFEALQRELLRREEV
jgi:hypothetical protein